MRKSKKIISLLVSIFLVTSLVPEVAQAKHLDFLYQLKFPVDHIKSHFYDDWKEKRGGGTRLHEGQDVRAPKGAKIVAVADGEINTVGYSESSGYYIAIDHLNGWLSLYVHLDDDIIGNDNAGDKTTAFAKDFKKGDPVKQGDILFDLIIINAITTSHIYPGNCYEIAKGPRTDKSDVEHQPKLVPIEEYL